MEKRCYGCMQIKKQSPICEHCGFNENVENLPHQLPLGSVLRDQYMVGKVLGQGGFGITYMGLDLKLQTPVAIKEYYPKSIVSRDCRVSPEVISNQPETQEQFHQGRDLFIREARALGKFANLPQVVHVFNFFQENNTSYIIMEHIRGVDLKSYVNVRGGKLPAGDTMRIVLPVMDALSKIHEAGLVHRDISPDNIMILFDGSAKLLDFGAALKVENSSASQADAKPSKAVLKRGFAPIEQYQRNGNVGPWTDVYALCATIYYCMTGEVPQDALRRDKEGLHPDWRKIPGLTEGQAALLEKGLALQLENRVPSVAALKNGLLAHMPILPHPNPDDEKEQQKKPGKKMTGVLLAAALAVVVAAGALFGLKGGDSAAPTEETIAAASTETQAAVTEAVPVWEPGVARANYGEAVYRTLDAGTEVNVIGRYKDYFVIEGDDLDLLVYQDYIRTAKDEKFQWWDGYSQKDTGVYKNVKLEGDPFAILEKNTKVRVLEGKGSWVQIEWDGGTGFVSVDNVSQWYITSFGSGAGAVGGGGGGSGGVNAGDIAATEMGAQLFLLGEYYGPRQESNFKASQGKGKGTILADGTEAYITLLMYGDEVKVTEYTKTKATIWLEGDLYAQVSRKMLRLDEDKAYNTWDGNTAWDAVIYSEAQLRNVSQELSLNKVVTVVDELPGCYVVEFEGKIGYMPKDKVSRMKY
ncbi:MAG: serine/threonine protein kinase [Oscillospiraceae bacterium]|nr:serine/threonine protein kinase [Oscillospiraceae bacterium]